MSKGKVNGIANEPTEQFEYTTGELMKRFLPYLMKYRWILIFDLFCASLTTGCDLALPLIMRYITNVGLKDAATLSMEMILRLGALYLILRIIDCVAGFYMTNTGHVMGARIETDMRRDVYAHLQRLSDTYYNNTKIGQIMGSITNDLFEVTEFSHHCPEEFFIAILKTVISFVILLRINVPLTLVLFLIVPVMFVVCVRVNSHFRKVQRSQRVQVGELNAAIEDSLLGHRVVKAFTNEALEEAKFEKNNVRFLDLKRVFYRLMSWFHTTIKMFDALMYLTVVILGSIFLLQEKIAPGDLVAYLLYVTTLITTIRRIVEFTEQFQRGVTGIDRFLQLMDAEIEIFDEPGAIELVDPKGEIEFTDVSFEYPDDHNQVFQNLNLSIHAGEKVAFVGPSGGGKTTLCNLIPRFYDISSGRITLDGRDIKDYTLKSLRGNIGIVQQDVYLFSGTVYENIVFGRPGASPEEVVEAAKKAGADGFIRELHDGYDTYIGERGVKLSGGQKQRISIARVFLKNPPMIILDEATSALDNESEYLVAESLARLAEGRTTLTVAHRLSTIRNSDRIMVLTEDGIAESGNHEELMERDGIYRALYDMANRFQ